MLTASRPSTAIFLRASALFSAVTTSAQMRATTSRGVALATTSPNMLCTLKPGGVSATASISGAMAERFSAVPASGLSLPLLI